MGSVYTVYDTLLFAHWAVKEHKPSPNAEEDLSEEKLFKREGELLSHLNHPGLPRFIDYFEENGSSFIVMEKVAGLTLDNLLKNRRSPLSPHEAVPIILQALHIIKYLHSQNPPIVYRDLKPSNIMLSPSGRVRLIDFGIARYYDPKNLKDTQELGTPGFCAPEQYHGHSSIKSDIYSAAVTLYYMLTLKEPQDFNFSFPQLTDFGLDKNLSRIVASCLELDPAKRTGDIEKLSNSLEETLRKIPIKKDASTQSLQPALLALKRHCLRVPDPALPIIWNFWKSWLTTIYGPKKYRRR